MSNGFQWTSSAAMTGDNDVSRRGQTDQCQGPGQTGWCLQTDACREWGEKTNARTWRWWACPIVQSFMDTTYRDGGLDELLDLTLGGVGPQSPQHLPHLGHLQHGSRVNKVRSPPPWTLYEAQLACLPAHSRVERNKWCSEPAPSLGRLFSNSRLEYQEKEFKNMRQEENNELVNTNDKMSLPVICKWRMEEFCFINISSLNQKLEKRWPIKHIKPWSRSDEHL